MVYAFFALHWSLAVLLQSLFQHRYAAHGMYTMGPRTERALHLLTFLVQGSSYLSPRAYAILHREHHAFADTERDPHSPHHQRNLLRMMRQTKRRYEDYAYDRKQPEPRFLGRYPEWPLIDRTLGQSWPVRFLWGGLYTAFYLRYHTRRWQLALLPLHFVLGPVHGAIVNWCGHKYGYRNFESHDASRNTLPLDVVCMGELFQNNHHQWPMSPDFAARRWEVDPTWQVMRVLVRLGLITIATPQRARHGGATPEARRASPRTGWRQHAGALMGRLGGLRSRTAGGPALPSS